MNTQPRLIKVLFALLLPVLAACQQNQQPLQTHSKTDSSTSSAVITTATDTGTAKAPAAADTVTICALPAATHSSSAFFEENFEQGAGSKSSYAAATVKLASGSWILDDALLGSSNADAKKGNVSLRLRNAAKVSMQFGVNAAKTVSVQYGSYGTDGPSDWQLWQSADGGASYHQLGETVSAKAHTLTRVTFNPAAGTGMLRFEIRKISGGKNRLNIDDFTINGDVTAGAATVTPPKVPLPQSPAGRTSETVNLLLGNPSKAAPGNAENYLIDQTYYIESYSRSRAVPNWVSWHIGNADLGSTDRLNNFGPDTRLPEGWYEVDNTSYKGSGFDKGHNCPSGDRTSSTAANAATFLMDNMIPQAPNNNQHTWEHLESYCRAQVKKGFEAYVIMGSYGSGGTGRNGYKTTIDQGRINVPAHIWKVVVLIPEGDNDLQRINANTTVIAVNTPNNDTISPDWMKYTCTVRDIEQATGYNLLSALPIPLQNALETHVFKGGN